MIGCNQIQERVILRIGCALVVMGVLVGCNSRPTNRIQGYVEGEFVYVASPLAGQLESLFVQRGQWVKARRSAFHPGQSTRKGRPRPGGTPARSGAVKFGGRRKSRNALQKLNLSKLSLSKRELHRPSHKKTSLARINWKRPVRGPYKTLTAARSTRDQDRSARGAT